MNVSHHQNDRYSSNSKYSGQNISVIGIGMSSHSKELKLSIVKPEITKKTSRVKSDGKSLKRSVFVRKQSMI